jgi:hypothetical protein
VRVFTFAQSPALLRDLGVTHIVCDALKAADTAGAAWRTSGIEYLYVDLPDSPSDSSRGGPVLADHSACSDSAALVAATPTRSFIHTVWDAAITFITGAIRPAPSGSSTTGGAKVLIYLHGRSRSAGVALAWLMHARQCGLDEAQSYLLSRCSHSIDWDLVNLDELRRR